MRDATTEKAVWWDNNKPMTPEQFELLLSDFREHAKSRELFVQDLFAGADPAQRLNARMFVEYAWHALFIRHLLRRPRGERAGRLQAAVHRRQPAELPRRSQAARRALRDGDRLQLRQAAGSDRRQLLCRRDQEIGLHLSQLCDARSGRDADALLGQRRHRRRCRGLLRPVGHRQDHAVGRSQTHPARRRRARLVAERDLSISRAAATPRPSASPRKPSPRSGTPPTASAPCSRTSS